LFEDSLTESLLCHASINSNN